MSVVPRVYVLGNSPLGNYFAYQLAQLKSQPDIPNVVLLLSDQKKLKRFLDNNSKLNVGITDRSGPSNGSKQFMAACSPPTFVSGKPAMIENLIVTENSKKNLSQLLKKYSFSLHNDSNILLVDPPVGSLNYIYDKVWVGTDSLRPNLLLAMTKESGSMLTFPKRNIEKTSSEFGVTPHVGGGKLNILLGSVPDSLDAFDSTKDSQQIETLLKNPLINLLQETENISVNIFGYSELAFLRFEGLIVNSCIEPLAILFDCKYINELLLVEKAKFIIRSLIKEQVKILKYAYPTLKNWSKYRIAFDIDRLYSIVIDELQKSPKRKSLLQLQMNGLNLTDIDQLTGFFVRLAYTSKIDCRWNETINWLIKGKIQLGKVRALDYHYL